MSDSTPPANTCPQCGATVATGAPEGLCPRCVAALNLYADTAITGAAEVGIQPPHTPEEIAAHFPQLEVIEFLGRGGMGVVYKARQKALGRPVALKLLAPERVADPKFAERFAHEAKALAALSHPSIVTIHDFGQAGGFFYLLMEFVDGVNLRQAMKAGRFTPEQALAIVPPVCEALQYAHEHGIVHRDIKPENLLLDKEGRVKLADFGIAKIMGAESSGIGLSESQPAGTPQYMAPEQTAHGRTDHRADIYSLGAVLYEMLTGELPADKLRPPSQKVQIDVRLDEIVLRALEKTPELRYQTAAEMRTQVEAMTRARSVATHDAAKRPVANQLLLTVGTTLLLCVACIGLAVFAWKVSRSEKSEANALHSNYLASKVRVATATRLATASGRLSPVSGAPAKWQIKTLVAEADTVSAKIGQDVTFTIDAFPQVISLGKIAQIGTKPIMVQNSVTYETIIDVNEGAAAESKFKPGMTVSVTFIVVYPGLPGGGTSSTLEEDVIRLASEHLEQTRQLHKADVVSLGEVDEAEGELALAEARGDQSKRAEVRLTMATKYLERLENAHRKNYISDAEYNEAKQRKLEAELKLQRTRSDPSPKTEKNADLKSAE